MKTAPGELGQRCQPCRPSSLAHPPPRTVLVPRVHLAILHLTLPERVVPAHRVALRLGKLKVLLRLLGRCPGRHWDGHALRCGKVAAQAVGEGGGRLRAREAARPAVMGCRRSGLDRS